MCKLLQYDITFEFDDACVVAFETLMKALVTSSTIIARDWDKPFEIMCNASDYVVDGVLWQRHNKVFHFIYYASRTMIEPQLNYSTIEKELLGVVFAFYKFRFYHVGTKVIVYTNHAAIRYLKAKKDAKPMLIFSNNVFNEIDAHHPPMVFLDFGLASILFIF